MSIIQPLLNLVDEKINAQSIDVSSSEILELIEHYFIELDTPKFNTILSNNVVKSIANKIEELEHVKNSLGSSRTNSEERRSIFAKINDLKDLLKQVFTIYHHYLKGDKFFQIYEKEENEKFSNYEDKIINGSLNEAILESIMYPTYFDVEKIQYLSNVVREQIKSLNLDKVNYNYAKDRTTSFYNKTKDSIYTISKTIDKTDSALKYAEIKFKTINENEVYEDDENSITYNLKDYYYQNVIDLYYNLGNLNKHKNILIDLFQDLAKSYPYLADLGGFTPSKITVFGDSNFEVVKQLAFELKEIGFVSNQTTVNDLIEVFILNDEKIKKKIDLTNGNLNDFGCLLFKMKPLFISSIKANYNTWWEERFTFNSIDKNKKSVSNMITNIETGRRFSSKNNQISKIIESLKLILQ